MSKHQWLNDNHITVAQELLQKQFPQQNGLQSTLLLAEKLQYRSSSRGFVQIVNISRVHWVCVSNINCPPEVVEVFDSIPSYSIKSHALHEQIAAILQTYKKAFTIRFIEVQRQSGSGDCGPMSIAFAHTLCNGLDPHLVRFDQRQLREHLLVSFQNKRFTPFPTLNLPQRATRTRHRNEVEVKVYCSCRLPWKKKWNSRGDMVQCCRCGEWFHQECENIPIGVFSHPLSKSWYCSTCI